MDCKCSQRDTKYKSKEPQYAILFYLKKLTDWTRMSPNDL